MPLSDIWVVLVEPAHPGNIGAVARAMKTMSLSRLVLVKPTAFPSEEADRRSMGAIDLLQNARVVDSLEDAISECRLVFGCSARARSFPHELFDPRECAQRLVDETAGGEPAALVFGPERTGLSNRDLDRCTFQVLIPANPEFSSLNLASAVQLLVYELFLAAREPQVLEPVDPSRLAIRQIELEHFFGHVERALDSRGFLDGEMREVTMMKLRRLFGRARPNSGELKILHTMMKLIHKDGK